ncbi:hypothetical protein CsSME_00020563 [Camellia sinensis var. sinensis]
MLQLLFENQHPITCWVEKHRPGSLWLLQMLKKMVQLTITVSQSNSCSTRLRLKASLKTIFQSLMVHFKVQRAPHQITCLLLLRNLSGSPKSALMLPFCGLLKDNQQHQHLLRPLLTSPHLPLQNGIMYQNCLLSSL